MVYTLMLVVFVLGYAAIALEHQLKIDKAAAALVTGVVTWTLYIMTAHDVHHVEEHLLHHLSEISSILFFLIGAMTIVELVDAHEGFSVITDKIKTTKKVKLMWIICVLSFFFSAALDNLTTSIVMVSLLRKLIEDKKDRWFFAGMVVVAANAGGAWSPIGDVTTTMLWIKGQITAAGIIKVLIIPSIFTLLAPLAILSFRMKGNVTRPVRVESADHYTDPTTPFERNFVFFAGVAGLIFVPIFKTHAHASGTSFLFDTYILVVVVVFRRERESERENAPLLSSLSLSLSLSCLSLSLFLKQLLKVGERKREFDRIGDVGTF